MADAPDDAGAEPVYAEVAGTNVGALIEPYIGELSYDPRSISGYRDGEHDISLELALYRDVLRDERAYAALSQRLDAAIAVPWEVQPGGSMDRDRMAAASLLEQIQAIPFDAVCRQMLHAIWYGYAVAEAIWAPDGARVRLANLCVRAPDRFRWSVSGELMLRSRGFPTGRAVPPQKFIALTRPGEHGDVPHAPGLARWCYWPVWLKRNGLKFWAVALDKFGTPTAMGHHRQNPEPGEVDKLKAVLRNIASGSGIALPEGQLITLLQSAARAGGDFNTFVGYFDHALTTLILGQSSTTDQGPWRGTAEVQKDVRDEGVASDCALLDHALSDIARWLTAWNYPGAETPRIVHDAAPAEDLDMRAAREEIVGRTSGLRPTKAHVEAIYGGEWEMAPASPMHGPDTGVAGGAQPRRTDRDGPMLAAGDDEDPIGRSVSALLAGDGWAPLMEPMVQPIQDAIAAASERGDTLEEFSTRVPDLMREMDETAAAEALHNTTFSAALSGQAGLDDETER